MKYKVFQREYFLFFNAVLSAGLFHEEKKSYEASLHRQYITQTIKKAQTSPKPVYTLKKITVFCSYL